MHGSSLDEVDMYGGSAFLCAADGGSVEMVRCEVYVRLLRILRRYVFYEKEFFYGPVPSSRYAIDIITTFSFLKILSHVNFLE